MSEIPDQRRKAAKGGEMKTMTRKKFREIIAALYWQAHSDGMVAHNGGTKFGQAEVSIEGVVLRFFKPPRHVMPKAKRKAAVK